MKLREGYCDKPYQFQWWITRYWRRKVIRLNVIEVKHSQRLSPSYFNMLKTPLKWRPIGERSETFKYARFRGFLQGDCSCILTRMRWKKNVEKIPRPIQTNIKQELVVCKARTRAMKGESFAQCIFFATWKQLSSLAHRLQWRNWWIRSEWWVGQRPRCM